MNISLNHQDTKYSSSVSSKQRCKAITEKLLQSALRVKHKNEIIKLSN